MPSISPEFWHFIPGSHNKPFGYSLDLNGGSLGRFESLIEEKKEKVLDKTEETSRGIINFRFVEGGFNVLAADLGIGLFYDERGFLENMGVDLIQYCMNMRDEEIGDMGGLELLKILETMMDRDDRLFLSVDLKEKVFAVANINAKKEEKELVFLATEVDFSRSSLATVNYRGLEFFVGIKNVGDEFSFGVRAGEIGGAPMLMTRILTDCNYRTFLTSKALDRYDQLARRIFF